MQDKNQSINPLGETRILENNVASVTLAGSQSAGATPGATATQAVLDDENTVDDGYAPWGTANDYPQLIIAAMEKNSVGSRALGFKADSHFAEGMIMYKRIYDENNKEVIQLQAPADHPEVRDFMSSSKINRYLMESITDYEWFGNTFPEMIVSKDFTKITSIRSLEAAFCRYKVMDQKTKKITELGYNAKWPSIDEDPELVAVVDPWMTAEEIRDHLKKKKIYKFVYPTYAPSPGRTYYRRPYWHAAYNSGWVGLANSIPNFKKSLLENQMTLKYHIKIPYTYWKAMYNDWDTMGKEKQKELVDTKLSEMNDFLSGTKNAGKAFASHFATDPITGKPMAGWEIIVLDDKMKDGAYIPDAKAANEEILFAIGVDPTLIGAGSPGGKLGAGSGSDKREAFGISLATSKGKRNITMEPLHLIRDFNGWDPDLNFGLKDTVLTTVDKNPTGSEKVMTS